MKNKNGFTLVELLAVIVVLAIILVLAIPNVLESLSSSKKKNFDNYTNKIVKAVEEEGVKKQLSGNSEPVQVYNIETDLGLASTGNYKGVAIVDKSDANVRKCSLTMWDGEFEVVDFDFCKNQDSKIPIVEYNEETIQTAARIVNDLKENNPIDKTNIIERISQKVTILTSLEITRKLNINKSDVNEIKIGTFNSTYGFDWKDGTVITEDATLDSAKAFYKDNILYLLVKSGYKMSLPANSIAMFSSFANLTEIKGLSNLDTSRVTNFQYCFGDNPKLKKIDLSGWDTSMLGVGSGSPNDFSTYEMFYYDTALEEINLSGWDNSHNQSMSEMFIGCKNLKKIIGIENLETSSVKKFYEMFMYCQSLTSLDLHKWNVSNGSEYNAYAYMFFGCTNLKNLNINGWKLYSGANSESAGASMFKYCSSLTSISLDVGKNSNPSAFDDMFANCTSLKNVTLKGNLTGQIARLFDGCTSLETADLSGLTTSGNYNLYSTFYNNTSLKKVDISGLDFSKIQSSGSIFSGCSSLTEVKVNHTWDSFVNRSDYSYNINASTNNFNVKYVD